MPSLTNRQRNLLQLANQLSQNLVNDNNSTTNANLNKSVSIDFPGVDFDAGLSVGLGGENGNGTGAGTPDTPTTLREALMELSNEQVEITTTFGPVSGTLISVQENYVVLVEADGNQVLVRLETIELVSEL